MNVVLWVVASVVALAMLAAGASKLTRPRHQLIATGSFDWAQDFTQTQVRLVGVVEVLGAIGLVLPAALDVEVWLTPLAAAGVALVMLGAVVVHLRRGERNLSVPPLVLAVLAGLVAVLRVAPFGF
jgi:uncharacterized membrane protein